MFDKHLFPADKPEQLERREEYKSLITNNSFFESVKEIHNIFRLCRRYLRVFDREKKTSVADVVPCTEFLGAALDRVPTSDNVLTPERLGMVKALFNKRKDILPIDEPICGRGIQVRLIEDVHVAACLLHPTKFLVDYERYNERFYGFIKRFVKYRISSVSDEDEADPERALEAKRVALMDKMLSDYDQIHSRWMLGKNDEDSNGNDTTAVPVRYEMAYRSSPLRFWSEESRVGTCPELCELALRTLSISPSSCAAERSFSAQGRMRTKLRNRLGEDILRKMMFIKWNIKHYDEILSSSTGEKNKESLSDQSSLQRLAEEEEPLDTDGSESESSCDEDYIDLVDEE